MSGARQGCFSPRPRAAELAGGRRRPSLRLLPLEPPQGEAGGAHDTRVLTQLRRDHPHAVEALAAHSSGLCERYAGKLEVHPVSAATGEGLDGLAKRFWEMLAMVRVYTKQQGKEADLDQPFTLPLGATVEDMAREIHRELPEKMKYARIWGRERVDGRQVHRGEILRDKDIVEIHQ